MGNMCVDNRVNDIFINLTGRRLNTLNESLSRVYLISICERVITDLNITDKADKYNTYLVIGSMLGINKDRVDAIYSMNITDIACCSDSVKPFVDYGKLIFKSERPNLVLDTVINRLYRSIEECRSIILDVVRDNKYSIPLLVENDNDKVFSMLYLVLFLDRYCVNISLDMILFILGRVTEDIDGTVRISRKFINTPRFKLKLSCANKLLVMPEFKELKALVRAFNKTFVLRGLDNLN